ncbi:MAG: sulfatase-like hydrolase/transferase [Solirubrobacterales bacterium]
MKEFGESPQLPEDFWQRRFPGKRESLRVWLELAGCWSLAIAWPVYQRLDSGTEALTFYSIRGLDLLLFIGLVSLLVPTVLLLVELLIGRVVSFTASRVVHAGMLGILLALVVWQSLQDNPLLAALALLAVFLAITVLYLRLELVRNFALMLSIATPVVIILFAAAGPIRYEVLPGESAMAAQSTDAETPVVMIVMDELPLALLQDESGSIDRKLLPNLARIADQSTWYPNTNAVGDETLEALPAIMTGEDPAPREERPPPGLPSYPDNVCSIPEKAGFSIHAKEAVTDLCSRKSGLKLRMAEMMRLGVFARPPNLGSAEGAALPADELSNLTPKRIFEDKVVELTNKYPPLPEVWSFERPTLALDFTRDLKLGPKSFNFFHLLLPHSPYQFLADGSGYPSFILNDFATGSALQLPENVPESRKNMQQALSQTIYTFTLIERIIQRMKDAGVWDESLFVLTADHGASFKVGHSRRTVDSANAGWMIPVPLFIKYPGQEKGQINRRQVSSGDITPTVLDVLGLEPSPEATGKSLLDDPGNSPDEITVSSQATGTLNLSLRELDRQRKQAVKFRNSAFGSGSLFAIGGKPDLLGTNPARQGLVPLEAEFQTEGPTLEVDPSAPFVPVYVQAQLPGIDSDPGTIAVAVNGKVAATTRAWQRDGAWMTAVNVPVDAFRKGTNRIVLYRP